MSNETMIRLENIKKRFQTKAGELEVLPVIFFLKRQKKQK